MSSATILALLKGVQVLIAFATTLASLIRNKNLMDAGEAKATARSLAALSHALGISQQVREEVAAMSDEDLNRELRGD